MSHYGGFAIFSEHDLREYLEGRLGQLRQHIYGENPEYILNVNEGDYLGYLEVTYSIDPLVINFDGISVTSREALIPAESLPGFVFDVRRGGSYRKQVIRYHIPFAGDVELLNYKPSTFLLWTHEVTIEEGYVCFDVIDFYGDPDRIKAEADGIIRNIRQQTENVAADIRGYNAELPQKIKQLLSSRRGELGAQIKVVSSLGVPIRKSASIPPTFAVPAIRKKVVARPTASPSASVPVPTLDQSVYQEILQTIYEMGKVFERHPSTYAGRGEEALRDYLILQLEPRFEGSTTGETFNKTGKTDILIRYEKRNIFVAECKFWDGKVKHLETIDQILSYLTWRDSKTAIIYFVNRKEITPVLDEIEKATPTHPCFVRKVGERDASWKMFECHLPGDPGCGIVMAILAFHIPS